MKKCPYCAEEIQDEAIVCRYCGRDLVVAVQAPPAPVGPPGPVADEPFGSGMALGATLLTIFAPFVALVAALIMRGSEPRPRRQAFLKTWAIASGAWLATGFLIGILVLFAVLGGGCRGGIDEFGIPEFVSTDGENWTAIYPCVDGGATRTPAPPGSVPQ